MRKPEPVRVVPGPRLIYLTHDPTIGKGSLMTAEVSAVADLADVIFVRDCGYRETSAAQWRNGGFAGDLVAPAGLLGRAEGWRSLARGQTGRPCC